MRAEEPQITRDRRAARRVHAPVAREHVAAAPGERRAAAAGSALARRDERLVEQAIELIDELPRALVAHAHAPPRGGDGAGLEDGFEKIGFAGPEINARRQTHAQADPLGKLVRFHEAFRGVGPEANHAPRRRFRQLGRLNP